MVLILNKSGRIVEVTNINSYRTGRGPSSKIYSIEAVSFRGERIELGSYLASKETGEQPNMAPQDNEANIGTVPDYMSNMIMEQKNTRRSPYPQTLKDLWRKCMDTYRENKGLSLPI